MLSADNLARSGKLEELLAPLNDPALSPERLAFIECTIQERVYDPGLIASCAALPAEHPLRQAAAAVQRAFAAVTTGPVTDEILSLPAVSRRSPLAPWKMLVWALASMYRRDAEACRRYLAAIPPGSAPAAYSRRIVSNNSILALLCILRACQNGLRRVLEGGQIRRSKWANSGFSRTFRAKVVTPNVPNHKLNEMFYGLGADGLSPEPCAGASP